MHSIGPCPRPAALASLCFVRGWQRESGRLRTFLERQEGHRSDSDPTVASSARQSRRRRVLHQATSRVGWWNGRTASLPSKNEHLRESVREWVDRFRYHEAAGSNDSSSRPTDCTGGVSHSGLAMSEAGATSLDRRLTADRSVFKQVTCSRPDGSIPVVARRRPCGFRLVEWQSGLPLRSIST